MLNKLAIRNVKRSFKDYLIYLITVTIAFGLMFAFNLITTSKEVIELADSMRNFKAIMYLTNGFIIVAICFLINYTNKFMFSRRSKEFGLYLVLGIKKKQITRMFTLENIMLGCVSLFISLPLGYLFSILMSAVIMNFFKLPHLVKISFNLSAVGILVLYFVIIYFIVLILANFRVKKMHIKNLLYYEKINEKFVYNKKRGNIIFIISLILGILGLIIFRNEFVGVNIDPSMFNIFISIFLIIISIYGVSINLADFILNKVLNNKMLKYHSDNLFIARCFYAKARTISFTLGTLSFLITIVLVTLNISSLFKGVFEYQLNSIATYDIAVEDVKDRFSDYLEIIKKDYTISEQFMYNGYINGNRSILNTLDIDSWRVNEEVIRLSDYNKLLELKGEKAISLGENEYFLHILREHKSKVLNNENLRHITLSNGIKLKQGGINFQGFSYAWGYGYGFVLVVPDEAVKDLEKGESHLIVNTKEDTTEALAKDLTKVVSPDMCKDSANGYTVCYSVANLIVRGKEEANSRSFMTISSFVCFYVAIIFIAIVGTILSIEMLSEAAKYKYRYQVLRKIGFRDSRIFKIVFKQILIFYIFPILYPLIVSFISLNSMNSVFKVLLVSDYQYVLIYLFNIILFFAFYLIYFVATYFGFKKNIIE